MPRYEFRGERLVIDGAPSRYVPARDIGGRIVPSLIVLHDTASGLSSDGPVSWLSGNPYKTSAHFVVARDGTITQMVPIDRKANHAGQSEWGGRKFANGFSIGVEIVNPGKMLARGPADAVSSTGTVYDCTDYGIEHRSTPNHGDGMWMAYTEAQLMAVEALVEALGRSVPTIKEVVGHFDVSPGRKVDPNPLMPWERMLDAIARARKPSFGFLAETDIRDAQTKLTALGYYTGLADGVMGVRTESAVFALQRENNLPPTGRLDAATHRLLATAAAKPMPTGHREEATETTLIERGSQTMSAAQADRHDGTMQTILATVTGVMVAAKALIQEAGLEIAILGACAVAAWYGWRQLRRGGKLAAHRLTEHHKGIR